MFRSMVFRTVLVLATLVPQIRSQDGASGVNLEVVVDDCYGQVINCQVETGVSGIKTVTSLKVLEIRDSGNFQVAKLDSSGTNLARDLKDLGLESSGSLTDSINKAPHLVLYGSLPENRRYQCEAVGNARSGVSLSRSSVEIITNSVDYNNQTGNCLKKMYQTLKVDLSIRTNDLGRSIITTYTNQLKRLVGFYKRLRPEEKWFDSLRPAFNSYVIGSAVLKHYLDVEGVGFFSYKHYVYYVSKREEPFDIDNANQVCRLMGGYLLEIKDNSELHFLIKKIKSLPWTTDAYFTGANDINREGSWMYYNSNSQIPKMTWKSGKPDNYKGQEDCMAIYQKQLDDLRCDRKGKFICKSQ
ncbi:CD209 antigen [Elysia marginata]|uniref:CD209 antigen n=1 Tax=Elysia marginata TaxID=1093978 RepID=A0AAV4GJ96_9GAST|nr:CD209 antigen [Elysia marginata]